MFATAKFENTLEISLLLVAEASVSTFLAGRLQVFFIAAFGRTIRAVLLWSVLFSLLILLSIKWYEPLKRVAAVYLKKPQVHITAALSLIFCRLADGIILINPLSGEGFTFSTTIYVISLVGAALLLFLFLLGLTGALKREASRLRVFAKMLGFKDVLFCVVLLAALNLCAWLYIKNSHTVYFWDTAGYWTNSHALADTARREGLVPLLKSVYRSILTQDYNDLIVLPWLPLVLLFGTSRWVFVAGIVNLGVFPALLLLYAFIRSHCRHPLFVTACAAACFPMLFYTAIVGFIDAAGVGVTFLATLLWLHARKENENGRYLLIGSLLALAILLRRWYAFFALSFFICVLIDAVFFRKSAAPLAISGLSFAFSLLFLFQPFVEDRLMRNYAALYSAYKSGLGVDFHYFFHYFGIFVVILSIVSALCLIVRRDTRRRGVFLMIQPVICFFLFTGVQTHGQQHLLLYVPGFLCLVTLLFAALADRIDKHRALASLLALFACLPMLSPLTSLFFPERVSDLKSFEMLPAFNYRPPVRTDTDSLAALVAFLDREVGFRGKHVGVLASSFSLNKDLLLNTDLSLGIEPPAGIDRRYLAWLPEVDSRDAFPGSLPYCDYYLVADPIQLHLGVGKQECVALPARLVLDGTGIGAAVRPVGQRFFVGNGGSIRVQLYEKFRPFTAAEEQDLIDEYRALTGK